MTSISALVELSSRQTVPILSWPFSKEDACYLTQDIWGGGAYSRGRLIREGDLLKNSTSKGGAYSREGAYSRGGLNRIITVYRFLSTDSDHSRMPCASMGTGMLLTKPYLFRLVSFFPLSGYLASCLHHFNTEASKWFKTGKRNGFLCACGWFHFCRTS